MMIASVHPFPDFARRPAETRQAPQCARNVPGGIPTTSGAHPFPADLEPLAASIFADLATDSVFEGLTALIDRALSERVEHRVKPLAAIADAAVDPLMDLRESLTEVMTRLARSQAIAEARDLDAAFADMPQDDQAVELGWLRADQRKALLWAQTVITAATPLSLIRASTQDAQ